MVIAVCGCLWLDIVSRYVVHLLRLLRLSFFDYLFGWVLVVSWWLCLLCGLLFVANGLWIVGGFGFVIVYVLLLRMVWVVCDVLSVRVFCCMVECYLLV